MARGQNDIPLPKIIPTAPWRVVEVRALPEYRLRVRFRDGLEGEVEMSGMVSSPQAGIFSCLRDPAVFDRVYLEYGAVTWPGAIDLAPDAMYAAIKTKGKWILM